MSGTRHNKNLHSEVSPTTDSIAALSPPTLKRVNTPPGLDLFDLLPSKVVTTQHKRSQSAAGYTIVGHSSMTGNVEAGSATLRPGTSASAMSALQMGMDSMRSPCFVHKTFGGSINLERVLDECRAEEMTHHNLLQTATGVREVARQLGISLFVFG
jgi:hypothetical protein